MGLDPVFAGVLVVFVVIVIADLYFDVLYQRLGRRVLLSLSSGRFPPADPSPIQRLLTSVAGLAVIVAFLLIVLLFTRRMP